MSRDWCCNQSNFKYNDETECTGSEEHGENIQTSVCAAVTATGLMEGCNGVENDGKRQGALLLPTCVRVLQWCNDSPRDQDPVPRLLGDSTPPADSGWGPDGLIQPDTSSHISVNKPPDPHTGKPERE